MILQGLISVHKKIQLKVKHKCSAEGRCWKDTKKRKTGKSCVGGAVSQRNVFREDRALSDAVGSMYGMRAE